MGVVTLDPQRVNAIFMACLSADSEVGTERTIAEGIVSTVAFSTERLNSYREEIIALLNELPNSFMETGGGGMSFREACMDKHGHQWTGVHQTMEHLFQLGLAIDKVAYLAPRELWPALPGGMPYLVVK